MDLLTTQYTAQSVALATGATPKQISDWCNQGLIVGQREPLGKGHRRIFSWFNVMEVAGALALMKSGVNAPGDAFRAAVQFSHVAEHGTGWVGAIADSQDIPDRLPGLPYHHRFGVTYMVVSQNECRVFLSSDGTINPAVLFHRSGEPMSLLALNVSRVFADVAQRLALDFRAALDEAYGDVKAD